ncbi:MAG: hypothetical protein ACP5NW_02990, partial [Candidatus Woesearchaeota archaeon]
DDTINDWNDRRITVLVQTNEPTICTISDSVNYLTSYVMDGDIYDYSSYSTSHMIPIDYTTALTSGPANNIITYTLTCRNKAGLQVIQQKNVIYDVDSNIRITKIAPLEEYSSGYTVAFSVMTNIFSTCYITNDSASYVIMDGYDNQSLYHEKEITVSDGWNEVWIQCIDESSYATAAMEMYRIFAGVNEPIDMNITTSDITCGLSSITATLHATRTSLDITRYVYSISDVTAGTVICSGTSNTGQVQCNYGLTDGRLYIIEAYAVDTAGHTSDTAYSVITAASPNSIICDYTPPTVNIIVVDTGFVDVAEIDVQCIDTGSGCTESYDYSIIDVSESCTDADYEMSMSFNDTLLVVDSGIICIRESDNNDNYVYANVTVDILDNNHVDITPVLPIFVDPNTIATTDPVTDIIVTTADGLDTECRYGLNYSSDNLSAAFNNFIPFDLTGGTTHTIFDFNTLGIDAQFIQIICYSPQLSENQYSSETFQLVYVENAPSISVSVNPNVINDWNDRRTRLSVITDIDTVCTVSASDGQNNGIQLGDAADSTTYQTGHYVDLNYDVYTISPSTYYYDITCRNFAGQTNSASVSVYYDLADDLVIEVLSPTSYSSNNINIVASTNVIGECTLAFDLQNMGAMYVDVSGRNHIMSIDSVYEGTHNVDIQCRTPIRNMAASTNYDIYVEAPAPVILLTECGDNVIQSPNDNLIYEECDGTALDGKSCTRGFVGYDFVGGELRCKDDCSGFDVSHCDLGQGWCGNDDIEGPNSQDFMEQCDGDVPGGLDCEDFGFDRGKLECNDDCTINTSGCMIEGQVLGQIILPRCGNYQFEPSEHCEIGGSYDIGLMCSDFGYDSGSLDCTGSCQFDFSSCMMDEEEEEDEYNQPTLTNCGNNVKNIFEECDGTAGLSDVSCEDLGRYNEGEVDCYRNCTYDISDCTYTDRCLNNVKDISESDIDCGGSCIACDIGQTCFSDDDCVSLRCGNDDRCIVNTCINGALDAESETSIDCGGECEPCPIDSGCILGSDCESGYCSGGICSADPCSNGIIDEGEGDVDCGGSCILCDVGQGCNSNADCGSDSCMNNICQDVLSPEEEKNPVKLPLILFGIVSIVGSGGYIIYRTFYEKKPVKPISRPPVGPGTAPPVQRPMFSPEQVAEIERRRRELMEKRRQQRLDERKGIMQKLSDSLTGEGKASTNTKDDIVQLSEKDISKSRKIELKTDEDGYADISQLNVEDSNKKETFDKLRKIGETKTQKIERTDRYDAKDTAEDGFIDVSKLPIKESETKTTLSDRLNVGEARNYKTESRIVNDKVDDTEFVDVSKLRNGGVDSEEKTFDKLKSIERTDGLGISKTDAVAKNISLISGAPQDKIVFSLNKNSTIDSKDALKMFGTVDKDIILSGAFKDVLSELVSSGKMSKEHVSNILFEYMDKGLLTKSDVAKISAELKII